MQDNDEENDDVSIVTSIETVSSDYHNDWSAEMANAVDDATIEGWSVEETTPHRAVDQT